MKKDLFFTAETMQPFSRIILSCPPTFPREAGLKHEKVIVDLARENRDVAIKEIEEKLGQSLFIYKDIARYARSLKKNVIDEDVVLGYFGGNKHINKVLNDIKASGEGSRLIGKYLLQHILKIVVFSVKKGKIFGTYKNGKTIIVINDLILPEQERSLIKDGDKGLVHFSIVISRSVRPSIAAKIQKEQIEHAVLKKVIAKLRGHTIESEAHCKLAKSALRRHSM